MKRQNRFYIIRHGQVAGYDRFPVYGHTDVELTEIGFLQMKEAAERLRLLKIHAVYSSDLKRSMEGGRQAARFHDVPFVPLPELREMYFGDWEGLTLGEIRERYPDELDRRQADLFHFEPPGQGESMERFSKRVMTCFETIREKHEGENVVIVAHGGVNRVILCNAMGIDLNRMFTIHQNYGCLNIIDYFPDSCLVRLMNG